MRAGCVSTPFLMLSFNANSKKERKEDILTVIVDISQK